MLAFFTSVVMPVSKEKTDDLLIMKTLPCYQLAVVAAALEGTLPVKVPVLEAVPDLMDSVAPLVGRKSVGRTPTGHKKRGPKGKRDDSKRIRSTGEMEAKQSAAKKSRTT